jgi:hypothetical protein
MGEFLQNPDNSSEISQLQAQEFVDAVEALNPLLRKVEFSEEEQKVLSNTLKALGLEHPEGEPIFPSDTKFGEFAVGDKIVRVTTDEKMNKNGTSYWWSVTLDPADVPEVYLKEVFQVAENFFERKDGGVFMPFYDAIPELWDKSQKGYIPMLTAYEEKRLRRLTEELGGSGGVSMEKFKEISANLDQELGERPGVDLEQMTGLDRTTFTPERLDRIMDLLFQCSSENLL